jgi:hypothetical protein
MESEIMTPEQIYQQLIEVAEKLDIRVSEQNLRKAGLRVRSGMCKVHGEAVYIMDKAARLPDKISLLAECLALYPLDAVYLMPAVREVVDRNRPKQNPDVENRQRMIEAKDREGKPEERAQAGPETSTGSRAVPPEPS